MKKYTVSPAFEVTNLEHQLNALTETGAEVVQILDSGMNYWRIVSRKEANHGREEDEGSVGPSEAGDRKGEEPKAVRAAIRSGLRENEDALRDLKASIQRSEESRKDLDRSSGDHAPELEKRDPEVHQDSAGKGSRSPRNGRKKN